MTNALKTTCPLNHPYAGPNLLTWTMRKGGKTYTARACRACKRIRTRLAMRDARKAQEERRAI